MVTSIGERRSGNKNRPGFSSCSKMVTKLRTSLALKIPCEAKAQCGLVTELLQLNVTSVYIHSSFNVHFVLVSSRVEKKEITVIINIYKVTNTSKDKLNAVYFSFIS